MFYAIPHNGPRSMHKTLEGAYKAAGAPNWLKTLKQVESDIAECGVCNIVYGFTHAQIGKID